MPRHDPDRVFNRARRRVYRREISRGEHVAVVAVLIALVGAGAWVLAQHDDYDPAERDITTEQLMAGSIKELAYHAPLVPWRDPAARGAGSLGPDLGPFPEELLAGGWSLDGRVERYDTETLFEKINGAAEQYIPFGFRRLDYVTLEREGLLLNLELYDQGAFENALGVFAAQRAPESRVETRSGASFVRTAIGAVGVAGPRFFRIAASAEDEVAKTKAAQLIDEVLPALEGEGADAAGARAYAVLTEGFGLPFESLAYEKENAFQYAFLERFWFGTLDEPEGARVFLHEAEEPEGLSELYAFFVEEQSYEYATLEVDEESVLMRHEFLGSVFALAREGSMLVGVEGAPDAASARALVGRLREEVRRGG